MELEKETPATPITKHPTEKHYPSRLIRLREVLHRTGVSRSTWYAWIAQGKAPSPVALGSASAWIQQEVEAWIEAQIEKSRPRSAS